MRNSVSVVLLKAAQFDGWFDSFLFSPPYCLASPPLFYVLRYLSAKEDISFGNDQIALQMCSAPAEQVFV